MLPDKEFTCDKERFPSCGIELPRPPSHFDRRLLRYPPLWDFHKQGSSAQPSAFSVNVKMAPAICDRPNLYSCV